MPTGFDHWIILPGQGDYHNPVFCRRTGPHKFTGLRDRHHHRPGHRLPQEAPEGPAVLPDVPPQGPAPPLGPDDKHAEMYDGEDIPEPDTLHDDYATRTDAAREATMRIDREP